jgi:hypothetical protein
MKNNILSLEKINKAINDVAVAKIYAFVLLLLFFGLEAKAKPVDKERARQVATTFLNNNGVRSVEMTELSSVAGFSYVYVFTTETSFVLMAADDRVQPILGYSLTGRFDFENMPDNKRAWIQGYSNEIRYAVDNQLRASSEVTQQWRDLVEGNPNAGRAITAVAPLIQTQWDQGDPYNLLCPGGSVTGCVATAMAQVMYYWRYPDMAPSMNPYRTRSHNINVTALPPRQLDWDNMLDSYTSR